MFNIESPDFREGAEIPREFTCEGKDTSPHLVWGSPPEGTRSYALCVEDPDAPMGTFVHWVVYDVPAELRELSRGVGNGKAAMKDGIKYGTNDFGHTGYGGPCPPKGHGPHRYYFVIKALDVPTLDLPVGAKKGDVERALQGHVLAEAKIMGKFKR